MICFCVFLQSWVFLVISSFITAWTKIWATKFNSANGDQSGRVQKEAHELHHYLQFGRVFRNLQKLARASNFLFELQEILEVQGLRPCNFLFNFLILISIFDGNDNYHVRGGGGDFCMPGAYEYQPLHQDMGNLSFNDKTNKLTFRDLPHPVKRKH